MQTQLIQRALDAHQAREITARAERFALRLETMARRAELREEAKNQTAGFVFTLLGVTIDPTIVRVDFGDSNPFVVQRTNFSIEKLDFEVSFDRDANDQARGFNLYLQSPTDWCHIPDLEALGQRLSQPDFAALLAPDPSPFAPAEPGNCGC